MKNIWKYSGTYLTWTGIIHTAVALWVFRGSFWLMLKQGFVNTGGENPGWWLFVLGPVLLMFGPLLQYYLKATSKPAPMWFGIALFAFAAVGCLALPASGFWLFVPQAIIVIAANLSQRKKTL